MLKVPSRLLDRDVTSVVNVIERKIDQVIGEIERHQVSVAALATGDKVVCE